MGVEENMANLIILKDLAVILIFAKVFGLIAKKLNVPSVVGEIVAGVIIGPTVLKLVSPNDFLIEMAEIGVILLMFLAGLETDLNELAKVGWKSAAIAILGVFIPLIGGMWLYIDFYNVSFLDSVELLKAAFIGCVLTATSVSITVQVLRELGKLRGRTGTVIMGAAIIDDVIGIVLLTFIIGIRDTSVSPVHVIIETLLFFAFSIVVGIICYFVFRKISEISPHTRRIPIAGLALCFLLSYIAEVWFGVADITGAYIAGIILCNIRDAKYIANKLDVNLYMLFGPIFFTSIGFKTEINSVSYDMIIFSVLFVLIACITKIIGCGLAAKVCKFNWKDSLKIGVGMMNRGEVALIIAQKGVATGLLSTIYFTPIILMILFSAIITPICLKVLYSGEKD